MPTIAEATTTYCKIERSPATTRLYRRILFSLTSAIGPERDLARLSFEDLLDFMDVLLRRGLKDSTRMQYSVVIKGFCAWCVSRKYIAESPAADIQVRVIKRDPTDSRAVPPEDLQKMLNFSFPNRRNYALLMFMIDTGCRVGGLCSLTFPHLDLDKHNAWLFEKGAKWHQVFFGPETKAALRRWLDRRPTPTPAHDYVWTAKAPFFQGLTVAGVEAIVRRTSEAAECSRTWYPHAIRHAVGHAWAKAGLPATAIQGKLGHENVLTTIEHYFPHDMQYVEELSQRHSLIALRAPEEKIPEMPVRLLPSHRRIK